MAITGFNSKPLAVIGLTLAVLMYSPATLANGGDFFEELTKDWNRPNPDSGPGYFGVVRDQHGKSVAKAIVTATFILDGQSVLTVADGLGHYRITGFSKKVDPATVDISCRKQGFRLFRKERRILHSFPTAPIEVNCIMAPATTS